MPAEGFKGHVATDGSLLGAAGKWRACGWSVVQLDYDEELGPLHGMYGSMETVAVSSEMPCKPFVSAEALKACALIGLHLLAAEGEGGSSGSQSPDLGDTWGRGCPKSPEWISSPLAVRCTSTTTSAGLLKSSDAFMIYEYFRVICAHEPVF